jgi:hypothetical protein
MREGRVRNSNRQIAGEDRAAGGPILKRRRVCAGLRQLNVQSNVPLRAKLVAGTSLSAWVAVLVCGRLLTFFGPPYFHQKAKSGL